MDNSMLQVYTLDGDYVDDYPHIKNLIEDIKNDSYFENGDDVCIIRFERKIVGSITVFEDTCVLVLQGQVTEHIAKP